MRKKLALLLAAIMVIGMVPMTAFATTTNRISKVVSGDTDTDLTSNAPDLKMYEKDLTGKTSTQAFELDLANAEWLDPILDGKVDSNGNVDITEKDSDGKTVVNPYKFVVGAEAGTVKVTKLSAKSIIIEAKVADTQSAVDSKNGLVVKMLTSLTDEGSATVTIDPMESLISSGTFTFATVASGSGTVTVEKKADISSNGGALKNIVIKETNAGAMESGTLKFRLSSDWSFDTTKANVTVYPSKYAKYFASKDTVIDTTTGEKGLATWSYSTDDNELSIEVPKTFTGSDTAMTITLAANVKYDEDDVKTGSVCEMTVSGCGVDKTTLDVATAVTYGVTFTAEDKTVPTFYAGSADDDKDTLKVTMQESTPGSWLTTRKTKIVFPTGVKVLGVDMTQKENVKNTNYTIDNDEDHGEVTLTDAVTAHDENKDATGKAKIEFKFQLSISPAYTGDIKATLTGAGVADEVSAVVGTAVAPVKVEAKSTDAIIDYRHTAIGDITLTEAESGILKKGTTLQVKIDTLLFDDDPKVEVTSGDLVIDNVKTSDGKLNIKIKNESAKTPAVIKITGVELKMNRDIPAGSYALKLATSDEIGSTISNKTVTLSSAKESGKVYTYEDPSKDQLIPDTNDAIFKNSVKEGNVYDHTPLFDKRNVTFVKDYVNVVTAGRETSSFTTQIKVTIGANQMTAGSNSINLDVPAYISNGYTMLPVRAVTEALSSAAIVRWDDATKTVTITFGTRVISMKVGSKTMTINGVDVAMQAQCEITDARAFIPLRDLGYALGLSDNKIAWDDATKTATLN